ASWLTFTNNIIDVPNADVLRDYPWPHNHNIINGSLDDALGAGDMQTDPRLTDPTNHDYTPSPTSAAHDNGTASTSSTDVYGNPPSTGPTSDIGAITSTPKHPYGTNVIQDASFENQPTLTASTSPWFTVTYGSDVFGLDQGAGKAHSGADNAWVASVND